MLYVVLTEILPKSVSGLTLISSPGCSPGRAIVLPPRRHWCGGGVGVSKKFNVKDFYVMGKALSGELSCPCDRSCLDCCQA